MYVKQIILENWCRYRGLQQLDLEPKVYAVVARQQHNHERSNWVGKSTFLESIPFALFGYHRFDREEAWITRGERSGSVTLVMSNGTTIKRFRDGGATKLYLKDNEGEFVDQVASDRVLRMFGMSQRDFFNTCYFEQRQMARFILSSPSERLDMVKAWLDLSKLDKAVEVAKEKEKTTTTTVSLNMGSLLTVEATITRAIESLSKILNIEVTESNMSRVDEAIAALDAEIEIAQGRVATYERVQERLAKWQTMKERADSVDEIITNAREFKQRLGASSEPISQRLSEKRTELYKLTTEAARKTQTADYYLKQVERGFDGVCPVTCKGCHTPEQVQAELSSQTEEARTKKQEADVAVQEKNKLIDIVDSLEKQLTQTLRDEARIEEFRRQYEAAKDAIAWIRDNPKPQQVSGDDVERLVNLRTIRTTVERMKTSVNELIPKRDELKRTVRKFEELRDMWQLMAVALGPSGAQRKAGEQALAEIETNANALLEGIGIDLETKISWYTEGKKLASNCEECGQTFGPGQRVKVCTKCSSPRTQSRKYQLTVTLSDRSGAAEDLAGAAYQLAASSWLRTQRGTQWGLAMLDEPFGQLDHANKKLFATHIETMLKSTYGFEQAFVVAHDRAILERYPGEIFIEAQSTGNKITAR